MLRVPRRTGHRLPDDAGLRDQPEAHAAAVSQHRAVYTDATLAGALYFISPLSLPYVLERLTPQLEAAVEGRAPQRVVESSGLAD